jgi:hypothetical protein
MSVLIIGLEVVSLFFSWSMTNKPEILLDKPYGEPELAGFGDVQSVWHKSVLFIGSQEIIFLFLLGYE